MSLLAVTAVNFLAVLAYMSTWFGLAYRLKRLDVVDTAWGGGFIVVAACSYLQAPHFYSGLLLILTSAWGIRLGLHIASRNRKKNNDPRYDTLSRSWKPRTFWLRAYGAIFVAQGMLILLVSLPVTIASQLTSRAVGFTAGAGIVLWAVGFGIEIIADSQLRHFLRSRTPDQSVMDRGLWRYSRHPNYFGEIIVWWGIGLIASSAPYGWLAWLGPLAITYLIIFVSGIPPLEKRKQDDKAYQAYMRRTSPLIPLPSRR